VSKRLFRRQLRAAKRWAKKRPFALTAIVLFVVVLGYTMYMQNRRLAVDPATYKPLLQLIARVESKGNYNAYFGNAHNKTIDFTNMSVARVMQWQKDYVNQGSPSSAVGRYQIIDTTLVGLIQQLKIDTSQKFDEVLQDRLAMALLERRGAEQYINSELTNEAFAANLAKEWAALPKAVGEHPQNSYYAGDGVNRALVGVDEVRQAIEQIRPK